MSSTAAELPVIAKTYDLHLWSSRHVARFPRPHRFPVGDRLEQHLDRILDGLIRAKFCRDRVPLLRQVNLDLEIRRFQFRMAKDLRCRSIDSYGHATETVNEIGQTVGGWLKQSGSAKSS